jgi:hypothetical protein
MQKCWTAEVEHIFYIRRRQFAATYLDCVFQSLCNFNALDLLCFLTFLNCPSISSCSKLAVHVKPMDHMKHRKDLCTCVLFSGLLADSYKLVRTSVEQMYIRTGNPRCIDLTGRVSCVIT